MKKKIKVKNSLQTYTYELTEPTGKNFDPEFKPELTPKEMLKLGVFGGHYWYDGIPKEYPKSWFTGVKLDSDRKNPQLNFFKINASQPHKIWIQKNWIQPQDPHGWFEWYCRYYMGRRSSDDARQIKRWKAIKRHIGAIKKNCKKKDMTCRIKQRQAILHWGYDPRNI